MEQRVILKMKSSPEFGNGAIMKECSEYAEMRLVFFIVIRCEITILAKVLGQHDQRPA